MATLQLPGLSTGIDTSTLIKQLVEAEKFRLTSYQNQLAKQEEKQSAVNELETKLRAYKTAVKALSDSSDLRAFNTSSSDEDAVTLSASTGAYEGSHSIQIKQLATADRLVHSGYKYETSYVGAGSFLFSYNNQQMSVQTTADTTLEELAELINNDNTNPGVTASIMKYDNGSGGVYHLVLSGQESGADYQITIDTGTREVYTADTVLQKNGNNADKTAKLSELDDFSGNSYDFSNLTGITIHATDNGGTTTDVNFADFNEHSTIEDLIDEIESAFGNAVTVTYEDGEFKITDNVTGESSIDLSIDFITSGGTATLDFSQSVNGEVNADSIASLDPATFQESQNAQDSLIKVDGYPSAADEWISRSTNTIDDVISGVTLNLHSVTGNDTDGYESIEINLNRNTKDLKEKVQEMIEKYNEFVAFLDTKTEYNEETGSGILSSEYSLKSTVSILRNSLLLNATGFTAIDAFDNPSDIGLSFDADGMLELDESVFDEAIVDDYQGVLSLLGAQKSGSTSGTSAAYLKFYDSTEDTTAGRYNVRVLTDGTAWIKLDSEDWSQARQATVDLSTGTIYGDPTWDSTTMTPKYPEYNLQLSVNTSRIGVEQLDVTVDIRQGFAGSLLEDVEDFLHSTRGRVTLAQDSIEDKIDRLNDRIEREQTRLAKYEERLTARYARLETMLSNIQAQFAAVSTM